MLRQMVVAPGASEEERLALTQQIAAGEVEGPRMGVAPYPGKSLYDVVREALADDGGE